MLVYYHYDDGLPHVRKADGNEREPYEKESIIPDNLYEVYIVSMMNLRQINTAIAEGKVPDATS